MGQRTVTARPPNWAERRTSMRACDTLAMRRMIDHDGVPQRLRNDAVIVCAGGLLPTPLLQKIGIEFETKYGVT